MVDDPALLKRRFTSIYATCFAGSDDEQNSAYTDLIIPGEHFFVASLPARLPRELRIIRVFYQDHECLAIVDDIGPWNVRDRYWETEAGRPAAESQYHTEDEAQNGRVPVNRAGIDLSPEVFREFGVNPEEGSMVVDWQFENNPVIMKSMWDRYDAVLKDYS